MSRYEARPHQDVFVNSVLQMLKEKDKVLGQAACGFGKTLCMTFFIERSALETLILVNSIDLLNQTVETFERQGLEISSFTSKDKKFPEKGTVVCMTETLKKRVVKKPEIINRFDLFIIDECHVLIYEVLLKYFENKKLIGLTGTPVRLKRYKISEHETALETMSDIFDDIVVSESVQWLIDNGYLCQDVTEFIDFNYSGLKTDSSGEFTASSLKEVFESEVYVEAMINTFKIHCKGKKTVLYTSATSTNKLYQQALSREGFNCKTYDSVNNVTADRKEVVEWYENAGEDSVLINTGCFTTGFSHDNIEVIFVARATMSLSLWIQMIGRGARNSKDIEKPYFTLIDGGNNSELHGVFSFDRDWRKIFFDKQIKSFLKEMYECEECGFNFEKKDKICPNCGCEIEIQEAPEEKELKLFEIKGQKSVPIIPTLDLNFHINKGHTKYEALKVLRMKWINFLVKQEITEANFNYHERNKTFYLKFKQHLFPLYLQVLRSILKDGKHSKFDSYCDKILIETKKIKYEPTK